MKQLLFELAAGPVLVRHWRTPDWARVSLIRVNWFRAPKTERN